MLSHIPELSETVFTNWADAQVYREWFRLLPGSPAIATGPHGRDKGALLPFGASISGEPLAETYRTTASLIVGINRTGFSIPAVGWPAGCGYTHYRYRLDGGPWSSERPINSPISLLAGNGSHYVEVIDKRDSGLYQDDPRFGADAIITRSRTWIVETLRIMSVAINDSGLSLQFPAHAGESYTVQYRNALEGTPSWITLTNVPPQPAAGPALITDPSTGSSGQRFYRLRVPWPVPNSVEHHRCLDNPVTDQPQATEPLIAHTPI